jgi:hypothetical protein
VTTCEGMEIYNKVMKFFFDLKKDSNYDTFQGYLNGRAKTLGILQNLTSPPAPVDTESMGESDDEEEEEMEVPMFDIGEEDICAGFAVV